jgi:hypothetical protein
MVVSLVFTNFVGGVAIVAPEIERALDKVLRVLERAGLITRGREAQWRPRRLEAAPRKEVTEWAEEFRCFWDTTLNRLDEYLQHPKKEDKNHGRKHRK